MATTLVPGDTNGAADIFLFDRVSGTTSRVSITSAGAQVNGASSQPAINYDASLIAFVSTASTLVSEPDPLPCGGLPECARVYLHRRMVPETTRLAVPPAILNTGRPWTLTDVDVSADGRYVAAQGTQQRFSHSIVTHGWIHDLVLATDIVGGAGGDDDDLDLSADGKHYAVGPYRAGSQTVMTPEMIAIVDGDGLLLSEMFAATNGTFPFFPIYSGARLTADGRRYVASRIEGSMPAPGTLSNVYVFSRDSDGDGMQSEWERWVGLDPDMPSGADDPDGDGLTNLDEYVAGSHPRGFYRAFFAEGAESPFFQARYALFNPGPRGVTSYLRSQPSDGHVSRGSPSKLNPQQRREYTTVADGEFSYIVESDGPLVVDRTMVWDATGYGSHAETAVTAPSRTWLFAEGATHGGFDLFYLLQNPGATDADVEVTYLRPRPLAPVTRTYAVRAQSRRTIWVDGEGLELSATDLAARISATQPIVVERAMYLSSGGVTFAGGTVGAGVTDAAGRWFLAEGATGPYFDMFILIANPTPPDTRIRVTYLLPDGANLTKEYDVPGESRRTIAVDLEDPRLANTPVSALVESLDGHGIVVERAMWWPDGDWQEGHLSAARTVTGPRWAFADAEVGGPAHAETYVLIANTSVTAGTATVQFILPDGTMLTRVIHLAAQSRTTLAASGVVPSDGVAPVRFATLVSADGLELVVERAVYSNANGVIWAAGSVSLGTRLVP